MMIDLPKECIVDRFIPKKTFYEKVNISSNLKDEFSSKLNKIYWKYKISEDTIHISRTEEVEEIEVFELELKEKYNSKNILKIITKEIPYPILFCIKFNEEFQYAIKYSEEVYFSEWNDDLEFKFNGLNIKVVYDNIVKTILDIDVSVDDIEKEIQRKNEIQKLKSEINKLESKIRSEKQFNKKFEYNGKKTKLQMMLKELLNGRY